MTAAPITAPARPRVPATRAAAAPARGPCPRAAGGVLLAVCGVCPKAGTSTLSRLIALAAAHRDAGKVLLCHTGTPPEPIAPGMPAMPRRSLLSFFIRPAADDTSTPRVLDAPADDSAAACARFARRLARTRIAYALTVVDCATPDGPIARTALAHATHRAWVLPASADGLAHAQQLTRGAHPRAGGTDLVIARAEPANDPPALRELRALADEWPATLVLAPWLSPRTIQRDATALERAQIALQAILGVLERRPA